MRDYLPPIMIVAGLALGLSGAPDRLGLEGASHGLLIGAAICAPIWLLGLWRKTRENRRDVDREN